LQKEYKKLKELQVKKLKIYWKKKQNIITLMMKIIQIIIMIRKKINKNLIILIIKKIKRLSLKLLKMEEKKLNLIFELFKIILY